MTTFRLRNLNESLYKWIHQNEAETIDCIEGVLLDSLVFACKRGYCFAFETYCNPNSSTLTFKFIPYKHCTHNNPDYNAMWDRWYRLYDEVYKEEE